MSRWFRPIFVAALFPFAVACGPTRTAPDTGNHVADTGSTETDDTGTTEPEDSGTTEPEDTGVTGPEDTGVIVPDDGGTVVTAFVYAHTSSDLYSIDPTTFNVRRIAAFGWPNDGNDHRMTDIAITAQGDIWGVTFDGLYRVNRTNAACTHVSDLTAGATYNALSFVPDPNGGAEKLIAAVKSGILYEINRTTGAATQIGRYSNFDQSAGDIVSIEDAGSFATIERGTNEEEWIARIETNGTTTPLFKTNRTDTWGLGYWGGTLYGFTEAGEFITIDIQNQTVTSRGTSGSHWWGAGVTTKAPTTTTHM